MSAISGKTSVNQDLRHDNKTNKIKYEEREELIAAIAQANIDAIKELINAKVNVNRICFLRRRLPIIIGIMTGNVEVIKELIKANINLDKPGNHGKTALMVAAKRGEFEILKELIKANANVDLQDRYGWTALMRAVSGGSLEIVKELIKAKADVDLQAIDGWTALWGAAKSGKLEILKELINAKANVDLQVIDGRTALMVATEEVEFEILKELINAKANVDLQVIEDGWTALMLAVEKDDILEDAKKGWAIWDPLGRSRWSVLVLAAIDRHLKLIKELIYVANVNLQDKEGKTALMYAALANNSKVVRELLKAGADTTLQDKEGKTALMHAAQRGNKESTKLLLKYSYVDKYDTWVNEIENEDTKAILEDACQKNSVLIQKIEDVISIEISKIQDINEISLGDIEGKFVQEAFEKRLYKLEQDQQSKEIEIEEKINLINEKLKKTTDKTDVVFEKYQRKLELLSEQKKLYFNPAIRTFYFTIQALFETKLICMMLLLGGIIKRADSTTEKTIGGITEVATGALEVIPVAGAVLGSAITLAVREVVGKMGDDIKLAQAERIQKSLGNPKGATKFAEFAARKVTQKYEEVIRTKKINIECARRAGERVAKWMFKAIVDERKRVFDYFFVNNALIPKIDERHKKNNLFEDKRKKKRASKAEKKQVSELSRDQQDMRRELELLKEQQREFKITQLGQPIIEQFNSIIKDDFPKSKKTENIFEIFLNGKKITLKLCDERKSGYLKKLSKYSTLFSKKIINDWKITHGSIQIEVKFTHIAEDLKGFFEKSNLPIKIGI